MAIFLTPARPGGRAAAPPAGETDSLQGRRWSPLTDHPAGWREKIDLRKLNFFIEFSACKDPHQDFFIEIAAHKKKLSARLFVELHE